MCAPSADTRARVRRHGGDGVPFFLGLSLGVVQVLGRVVGPDAGRTGRRVHAIPRSGILISSNRRIGVGSTRDARTAEARWQPAPSAAELPGPQRREYSPMAGDVAESRLQDAQQCRGRCETHPCADDSQVFSDPTTAAATCERCAPRAQRTPSSGIRRTTSTISNPYRPIAASSVATPNTDAIGTAHCSPLAGVGNVPCIVSVW